MNILFVLLALFGGAIVSTTKLPMIERFDDFKMYKVHIDDVEQLEELKKINNDIEIINLDEIETAGRSYDIVVDPVNQKNFEDNLQNHKLSYEIMSDNLQDLLEQRSIGGILNTNMNWTQYHSLQDIYKWLDHLVVRNRYVVVPFTIGYSYEGRPIKAIKISRKRGNKAIFIEANIHAIEWISSAAGTCFINKLLTSRDRELRYLLNNYDWYFVPILNPDGFEYSHNVQPLWRKNRRPTGYYNSSGICYGTDMNRNFDFHWGEAGYNVNVPCDHWYGGSGPATEPEVQALQNFVASLPKRYVYIYLALHSFGNLINLPYGHTTTVFPPNFEQMKRISKGFADAAIVKYGTNFTYATSGQQLYPVSGSSKDWAYGAMRIPYAATIELRDRGTYGFFLPAKQIIPVCEELTDGIIGLIRAAERERLFR